jgi:hypothetical protein
LRELRFFAIFRIDFEYSVNALDAGFAQGASKDNMEAVIIACAAAKFVAREGAAKSCRFEN